GKAEKGLGLGGQQAAAVKARRDIAGEEQIIDLEAAAEREQDHQAPQMGRGGFPGRREISSGPPRAPARSSPASIPMALMISSPEFSFFARGTHCWVVMRVSGGRLPCLYLA